MTGLLAIGLLLLTGTFIYQEVKNKSPRKWINYFVKAVIVFCLAFIYFEEEDGDSLKETHIILTPGYENKHLDSIKKIYPEARIHNSESSLPHKQTDNLFILGIGLDSSELALINTKKCQYFPPSNKIGLQNLNFTSKVKTGEEVEVTGKYSGEEDVLVIQGFHKADTLSAKFYWKTIAEAPGNYLINIGNINLPIEVEPERSFNIFIKTSQPDFRTRFLKNFLAEEGHHILWESTISKNKYHRQRINNADLSSNLTSINLTNYDILILDPETIKGFGSSEIRNIKSSISNGLGLIILPQEGYDQIFKEWLNNSFETKEIVEEERIKKVNFSNTYSPLRVYFSNDQAFYKFYREGKIGTYTVLNEHIWLLSDQKEKYRELWKNIIAQITRDEKDTDIRINMFPIMKDQKTEVMIYSENNEVPELTINDQKLPLRQDLYWSKIWYADYWPLDTGWHHAVVNNTFSKNYYVQDKVDNHQLIYNERIKVNTAYWSNFEAQEERQVESKYLWLLFILTLLSFGYLWIEPKL